MTNTTNEAPRINSTQSTTTFLARQGKSLFRSSSPSHLAELESFNYNYSGLPSELARELKNTTTNIRVHYRNALQSLSTIGLQLIKTKDMLPRGEWLNWIKKEFEEQGYFTIYTAENYMNLAYLVQAHGLENLKNLPMSVLYILAREQEESFVDHIIGLSQDKSISRSRYKELKAEYKNKSNSELSPTLDKSVQTETIVLMSEKVEFQPNSEIINATAELFLPPKQLSITPTVIDYAQLTEVVIEQEETITYKQISSLQLENILFDYIFYCLSYHTKSKYSPEEVFSKLKFLMKDCALSFVFCSPVDLGSIIDYAQKFELKYLSTLAVKQDTTFRPDLNLSCNWTSCVLFYLNEYPPFEEYLKDYYSDFNSFVYSILSALPNKNQTNSLFIQSDKSDVLYDEDILFQFSNNYSHFVYQN